jgi:heme exporter protein D
MMPDLGKYALWVLSAYGVSLGLLAAITLLSVLQARRTRRALQRMEAARMTAKGAGPGAEAPAPSRPVGEAANG